MANKRVRLSAVLEKLNSHLDDLLLIAAKRPERLWAAKLDYIKAAKDWFAAASAALAADTKAVLPPAVVTAATDAGAAVLRFEGKAFIAKPAACCRALSVVLEHVHQLRLAADPHTPPPPDLSTAMTAVREEALRQAGAPQ
jgi:hypothetical protein